MTHRGTSYVSAPIATRRDDVRGLLATQPLEPRLHARRRVPRGDGDRLVALARDREPAALLEVAQGVAHQPVRVQPQPRRRRVGPHLHPPVELGPGEAREQCHHPHAAVPVGQVRPLAQRGDVGLGRAVGPARQVAGDAGHVHDRATATLHHRLKGGSRQPQHRGDQYVEEVLLLLEGVVEEPPLQAEARVVHQQVHRPRPVTEPRLHGRQLRTVPQVRDDHLHLGAVPLPQLRGDLLQPFPVARDEDEVVAGGGELGGERAADAGGRTGHHRGRSGHGPQHSWAVRRAATRLGHDGPVSASKTRVLAVANQKGGVAKTTTVASLGAALAELGGRVLLVDLDPQACLTFSLGIDPEDVEISVHHVLTKGVHPAEVVIHTADGVDLLPATIELARAEADLLTRTGREHVLKLALEDLGDDADPYDWVLLDCPPSLGVLTVAALTAADGVLIPLQCETLSHRGVGQLLDTVHDVRRFTNRELKVWGVLPTLYDGRTNHARAVLDNISETYDLDVLEPPIPKSIRFAEAPAAGRSILSTTKTHRGAAAYREIAKALSDRDVETADVAKS